MQAWARNLDNARDAIVKETSVSGNTAGFSFTLWAGTHSFAKDGMQAYQMALRKRAAR